MGQLQKKTKSCPIENPRTLYDFLGFEQHIRQIRDRRGAKVPDLWYQRPGYYVGITSPDKMFGPGEVCIPRFVEKPDYEFEIALVVGKVAKPMTVAEASDFIQKHCRFTIFNDWSARDFQKIDMTMGLSVSHSKSIIGNSFGPVLVPASAFSFNAEGIPDIPLTLTVNGTVRTKSNYNTVYWSFPKILAFLGRENISVFPGDIIGSGTVGSGCIAEFAAKVVDDKEVEPAKYSWLKEGDLIEMDAEGIGTLTSQVHIV